MLVHTLLSGVRVGGRTTVERVRGLWPQVREMCVLRYGAVRNSYELRVSWVAEFPKAGVSVYPPATYHIR